MAFEEAPDLHNLRDVSQAEDAADEASPTTPLISDVKQHGLSDIYEPTSRSVETMQHSLISETLDGFKSNTVFSMPVSSSARRSSSPLPIDSVRRLALPIDDEGLLPSEAELLSEMSFKTRMAKQGTNNYKINLGRFGEPLKTDNRRRANEQISVQDYQELYELFEAMLEDKAAQDEDSEYRDQINATFVKERALARRKIKELEKANSTLEEVIENYNVKLNKLQSGNDSLSTVSANQRQEIRKLHSELSYQQEVNARTPESQFRQELHPNELEVENARLNADAEEWRSVLEDSILEVNATTVDLAKQVFRKILDAGDSMSDSESAFTDRDQAYTMQLRPTNIPRRQSVTSAGSTHVLRTASVLGSPRKGDGLSIYDQIGSPTNSASSMGLVGNWPKSWVESVDGQEQQIPRFQRTPSFRTNIFDESNMSEPDRPKAGFKSLPSPRISSSLENRLIRVQSYDSAISPKTILPGYRPPLLSSSPPEPVSIASSSIAPSLPGGHQNSNTSLDRRNDLSFNLHPHTLQQPSSFSAKTEEIDQLNTQIDELIKSYGLQRVFDHVSSCTSSAVPSMMITPNGNGSGGEPNTHKDNTGRQLEAGLESYRPVTKIEVLDPITDIIDTTLPILQVGEETMFYQAPKWDETTKTSLEGLMQNFSEIWPQIDPYWLDVLSNLAERLKSFQKYLIQHTVCRLNRTSSAPRCLEILQLFFIACHHNGRCYFPAQLKSSVGSLKHRVSNRKSPIHDFLLVGWWLAMLWLLITVYFLKMEWSDANSIRARKEVPSWTSHQWVSHPWQGLKASVSKTLDLHIEPISHFT